MFLDDVENVTISVFSIVIIRAPSDTVFGLHCTCVLVCLVTYISL